MEEEDFEEEEDIHELDSQMKNTDFLNYLHGKDKRK